MLLPKELYGKPRSSRGSTTQPFSLEVLFRLRGGHFASRRSHICYLFIYFLRTRDTLGLGNE